MTYLTFAIKTCHCKHIHLHQYEASHWKRKRTIKKPVDEGDYSPQLL